MTLLYRLKMNYNKFKYTECPEHERLNCEDLIHARKKIEEKNIIQNSTLIRSVIEL